MWLNPQFPANLVTYTDEMENFILCAVTFSKWKMMDVIINTYYYYVFQNEDSKLLRDK